MPENPRIEELRRRVEQDPASIAFAQLAEELRRAGEFDESARVCRAGLAKHPTYLSARVTLGRALIELQQFDEAQAELELVLRSAPENLAAIRGLAEIHQRRGNFSEALRHYQTALALSKHDPELEESVQDLNRKLRADLSSPGAPPPPSADEIQAILSSAQSRPAASGGSEPAVIPVASLSPELEAAADEFTKALQALDTLALDLPETAAPEPAALSEAPAATEVTRQDRVVNELESWLDAIVRDRAERQAAHGSEHDPEHAPLEDQPQVDRLTGLPLNARS